jgi:hypothetical protein
VIQGRYRDTLRQINMVANRYRTDDRIVNTYAGMVANDDVAHSIVDATV